jgi:uncharacterized membrane protein YdjX (TVP38/TMEM64 family)
MKATIRAIVLLALMAGIVAAATHRNSIHPQYIRDAIVGARFAPFVFIALQIAASLLFVPRTVLGIAAGLIFGLYWGSILAIVGAVAGAGAGFLVVRWLGVGGALDAVPRIGKFVQKAESGGWRAVALVRLMPLPHSVANTALALTNVPWADYLLGSGIGMLPMTIAQVGIGASGNLILTNRGAWLAASLMLAAGLAASLMLSRFGNRHYR